MQINDLNSLPKRTIWVEDELIFILDQRFLPHQIIIEQLLSGENAIRAIQEMRVRGAPLIGITAVYGLYLSAQAFDGPIEELHNYLSGVGECLKATRPTAVNLAWAVNQALKSIEPIQPQEVATYLRHFADKLVAEDIAICKAIGEHGLSIIEKIYTQKSDTVQILTHCNAGRLGCVEWGTALAPIYLAHQAGIPVHVWVDETRPRNQGALTALELADADVPHTYIVDNVGGLLMRQKKVDFCIVGADRVSLEAEVANKIGTYLKALAAKANNIPFYVAVPSPTFDCSIQNAMSEIPIETRSEDEIHYIEGQQGHDRQKVRITPPDTPVLNYGFDLTPPELITAIITERGICKPTAESIFSLFPEWRN